MPKTTNTQVVKQCRALGKPYDALAEVFEKSMKEEETNSKLIAEADVGYHLWSGVSGPISFSTTSRMNANRLKGL
jgi:hypothetical protein